MSFFLIDVPFKKLTKKIWKNFQNQSSCDFALRTTLSSDAFKGVKKAQQKQSFIAKSLVTNNNKCNAAKTKNTL